MSYTLTFPGQPKEFDENANKHQVLATISFTPTRESEQRIIITKT
jgi:hypothetical protein